MKVIEKYVIAVRDSEWSRFARDFAGRCVEVDEFIPAMEISEENFKEILPALRHTNYKIENNIIVSRGMNDNYDVIADGIVMQTTIYVDQISDTVMVED